MSGTAGWTQGSEGLSGQRMTVIAGSLMPLFFQYVLFYATTVLEEIDMIET